jgi:tRNA 2-selenouridine synthase
MIQVLDTVDAAALAKFDDIIDVRSPSEFAEDHIPGAISLPVLTDAERAEVGTIYVQDSAFKARRLGAALVARNIALHLETELAGRPQGWKPLVYCWRGGQRSSAMATILGQVGWRTSVLNGGYRTYRRRVNARLYDEPSPLRLVLIDGCTGVGKTEVLARLAERGVQTLDLEALAEHRGSLFGALPGRPQPSQKLFETRLLLALDALDPSRPVAVEAESSKIGECFVPPALWNLMLVAPRIELTAPTLERARYLVRAYADIIENAEALDAMLARLPRHIGHAEVETWRALGEARDFEALAEALIGVHYDPAYLRSSRKDARQRLAVLEMPDLAPASLDAAAEQIAGLMTPLAPSVSSLRSDPPPS